MNTKALEKVELALVAVAVALAASIIVSLLVGCVPPTPAGPNYEATIAVAQARLEVCEEANRALGIALDACENQPTATPHVIVVTPVPPTPVPITPTPPYPSNLVSCETAPLGTKVYCMSVTTLRFYHDEKSNNMGQCAPGAKGTLIYKSMDADQLWWWQVSGMPTNDYPYGTKNGEPLEAYIKAMNSGCVPPK